VAVNEKPFQQAAEYVRPRGTVIVIGLPAGAHIRAPVFESVLKMVRIQASYVGNRQDSEEALEFFRRGVIHVSSVQTSQSILLTYPAGTIQDRRSQGPREGI
jgi:D-arabinose 1-dehydrogenase-like Zn-dependent alcohol dehydrogenase